MPPAMNRLPSHSTHKVVGDSVLTMTSTQVSPSWETITAASLGKLSAMAEATNNCPDQARPEMDRPFWGRVAFSVQVTPSTEVSM